MPQISFVILTWNSSHYLCACFDSIIAKCQSEKLSFEIIVVDNGSTDGSADYFDTYEASYPLEFKTIRLGSNTGTTYPRNLGIDKAQGQHICIIDSDTQLLTGHLSKILSMLEEDRTLGIVAPQLVLPDQSVQPSVKKFPTFWLKISKIPKAVFGINLGDLDFYAHFPFNESCTVDSAISACWFFRKDLVEDVGYLDEKIFYSPEDLDYSMRVWKAGKKIIYVPEFTVLHNTQQISYKQPFSKVSLSHLSGLFYYFKKHGGWFSNRGLYRKFNI
ncbi:MAG: glycosyltransferase family 2 protein [Geopsychrobacter sp.]|nr:glycosyltransferase family 2 protein [Geopsychrobacter sp.]